MRSLAKRERFTKAEILKDIINGIKQTEHSQKGKNHNKIIKLIGALAGLAFVAIEIIYPLFILWFCLFLIVALPVFAIAEILKQRNRIKNVRIEDYEIDTASLVEIEHESYKVKRGIKWYSPVETINHYTLKFDNGEAWCVPKDNYLWCDERPMTDWAICRSSKQGDAFIVVRKINTREIVMAYPAEFFEYRE